MLTEHDFNALAAQGHNRIPLVAQALADLDTPLSLYLKLTQGQPLSFLLESVVGGERFGRYSFVGLPARTLVRATDHQVEVVTDGQVVETCQGNPLDFIAAYQQRFKVAVPQGLPRFCGGLAGYFGYDTVRLIEPRLAAFDVEVSVVRRSAGENTLGPDEWRARLGEFDWVIVAVPATLETDGMIGAAELAEDELATGTDA